MVYLRFSTLLISILLYSGLGNAQRLNSSYICNFAKVMALSGHATSIAVRAGAGQNFRKVDKLRSGQEVYICDERAGWFKVYFSGPDRPCGSTSKNGLEMEKAKECQSGWIEKRWIDVISG